MRRLKVQPQSGFTLISALLVRLRRTELPALVKSQYPAKSGYMRAQPQRGFTLIELLVAIAIVGVLVSIGTVSFTSYQARGNDQKRKGDLQRIKLALEKYRLDHYYYPPISEEGCRQPAQGCAKSSEQGGGWIPALYPDYLKNLPKDPKQAYERKSLFARALDFLKSPFSPAYAGIGGGGGVKGPPTPTFRTLPPPTSFPTVPPTYASPTPTPTPPSPPQCSDSQDNDGDSLIDMADPGCTTTLDDDEIDPAVPPAARCADGIDNDFDGKIDYPQDPGCSSSADNDEIDPAPQTPTPSPGATPTPPAATPTPPGASPPAATSADFNLSHTYRYDVFPNHQSYILWASLENPNDPDIYYKSTATCRQEPPKSGGKYVFNYCVFPKI
ncbi:type II secretion system protein [Candidatus Woesebacteria bacterium]|nr:type II secretion system protein [Candidatus Woesebacteria bacterium]